MDFQNISREDYFKVRKTFLQEFKGKGTIKEYKKNDVINFNIGEDILLILKGRIKISEYSDGGIEKLLCILSPGDLAGEIEYYCEGKNNDIEVVALLDIKIAILSRKDIENALSTNSKMYECILKSIIRKYHIMKSQLSDIVFRDSRGKVASLLLRIAFQEGRKVGNHVEYFYIKQQDIANLIGCSRITVSRCINEFKKLEAIDMKDNKITILDEEKLEEFTVR